MLKASSIIWINVFVLFQNVGYVANLLVSRSPYEFGFVAKASSIPSCSGYIEGYNTVVTDSPTPPSSPPSSSSTQPTSSTQQPSSTTSSTTTTESQPSTTPTTSLPPWTGAPGTYNLPEVIHKSILFYEAQRSGALPSTNRIPWRGDSALGDQGQNGEDLSGGWYDAGDFVKFGFPMAGSVTVLTYGLLEFWDAYEASGELDNMLDCIKWPLDYFIKAHVSPDKFYGQVGDGHVDHAYWGRAENMNMHRPAWYISGSEGKHGSDLAGETAAAMAAGSIAFRKYGQTNYASELLLHATQLYDLAYNYRGRYSDAITNAAAFYKSWGGYTDELAWGALWLFRATGDPQYMNNALEFYPSNTPKFFDWDEKSAGALLLFNSLGDSALQARSATDLTRFLRQWIDGTNGITYTPKGLAWGAQWGSLRYASNAAFVAMVAAKQGILTNEGRAFAESQIHYALGDSGHSFVCGFGVNPPQRPHHSGSSCPVNGPCGWGTFHDPAPNPNILTGALVGGPDAQDNWVDKRDDYISNEVTTDYNAGFQSAVAALYELTLR